MLLEKVQVIYFTQGLIDKPTTCNYTHNLFAEKAIHWLSQQKGSDPFILFWPSHYHMQVDIFFRLFKLQGVGRDKGIGEPVPNDYPYSSKKWPDVEKDHAAIVILHI